MVSLSIDKYNVLIAYNTQTIITFHVFTEHIHSDVKKISVLYFSTGVGNIDLGGSVSLQSLAPTQNTPEPANQGLQDALRYFVPGFFRVGAKFCRRVQILVQDKRSPPLL